MAAATIPIISAVGHETDTTLIDFVSDRRAPTPTGAAELATPVLADLRAFVTDLERRLDRSGARLLEDRRIRLRSVARGLPARPEELVALAQQRLDHASSRLASGLGRNTELHHRRLVVIGSRFAPALLKRAIEQREARLEGQAARLISGLRANTSGHERRLLLVSGRLNPESIVNRQKRRELGMQNLASRLERVRPQAIERAETRLAALARALASLDPKRPKPGFARVDDETGAMVSSAAALSPGQAVTLVFPDGSKGAHIEGDGAVRAKPVPKAKAAPASQGDLF